MTETITILSVSTTDTDKVLAENCAYFLNSESAFCHCVCPVEVEFHENETLVTIKTEPVRTHEKQHPASSAQDLYLQSIARSYLAGYLAAAS